MSFGSPGRLPRGRHDVLLRLHLHYVTANYNLAPAEDHAWISPLVVPPKKKKTKKKKKKKKTNKKREEHAYDDCVTTVTRLHARHKSAASHLG